ncbi:acyl-CoA dehydrogenase [Geobacter argillaceus]|uniref:Butyryl-CoA dehydrogenase n=1 Tax=Geobacter argillaceus TaxID=345631 RepID=A0A562V8I3_9BACT|nr:acyl-CoA dehydrogenase [Geobacter argillaceus]TWJ14183.1 butyryl-CoA dehydrogenase [Geobacter argillaceus]
MSIPFISRRDIDFLLHELLDVEQLTAHPCYEEHSRETFKAILDVAEQIAREKFQPHNAEGDRNEPVVVDGRVRLIPEVKEALQAFAEAGFFSASHSAELGGIQLPTVLNNAVLSFFSAANIATASYAQLTMANSHLLAVHASAEQQRLYLAPMMTGRFFGTMAMTEPQAGSSISDLITTAEPTPQGHYLIRGNKIFISGGEHEMAENIVHLVLARIKGAPAGVKGISLFIVPRYRVNQDGSVGEDNDVALSGLIHKMGWRGTTSTMLNFGENGRCFGYLIGEPNQGLSYMFHMMNEARINIGQFATCIGYAGYLYSLDYARNRPQGRLPSDKDPLSRQVMIIEHADIRRMLLMQKAYVEGSLALILYASLLVDRQKVGGDQETRKAGLLLDILTPIVKAWPSKFCFEANSQAVQILGGYGYTRKYPVEQLFRDNRLSQIHEGTNGIQSIDLLGRKVSMENGAAFKLLMEEIRSTIGEAAGDALLRTWSRELDQAVQQMQGTTERLLEARELAGADLFLANASLYLEMLGHVVIAWIWLRQAQAAARQCETASGANRDFYRGKLQACSFFFNWELPKVHHQAKILGSLEPTCYAMQDSWF